MAIRRVQDLGRLANVLSTDLFEVSTKLNSANNLKGYISKNFSVGDMIQTLSSYTNDVIMTDIYSFLSYPIGSIVYSAKNLDKDDYLSGSFFPANGLEVFYDEMLSSNQVIYDTSAMTQIVQVKRNDTEDLFNILYSICSYVNGAYYVNEDMNLGVLLSYQEYPTSEYANREYDGYFIYDPVHSWVRLPKLNNIYITGTSETALQNTYVSAEIPNLRGQFVNGINTGDIVDQRHLSSFYSGPFSYSSENNVSYFKDDRAISGSIYRKSLTKSMKGMNLYMMYPGTEQQSVYNGEDDRVLLDSVCLRPYVVVSRMFRQVTTIG